MDIQNIQRRSRRDPILLACLGVAAVAVVAVTIFGVPVRTLFFFGMLALCPLMHLFMGHGHGSHGHDASGTSQPTEGHVVSTDDRA